MKKGLAIFAIIAFASSFVACKKDYTCTCTYSGTTTTYKLGKMKKSDAESACAVYAIGGSSCTI